MRNRFVAAVRWLWDVLRQAVWPRIPPKAPRTRQAGVLRAVLGVLARGPCAVAFIVAEAGGCTRAQVLAALQYGEKQRYVAPEFYKDSGERTGRWSITPAGLAKLRPKGGPLTPKPGAWFPAKFGVPRLPEVINAEQPPEVGKEQGETPRITESGAAARNSR